MSMKQVATHLASSGPILRLAALPSTPTTLRACLHASRLFSTSGQVSQSGKRKIQTSSAYHPYSLETASPPPRNVGVTDTSIAGSIPQVNDTRPPKVSSTDDLVSAAGAQKASPLSLTEEEAQKSKPLAEPTSSRPKTKPRPKLRPRKAAMNLTPRAVEQLRGLLDQPKPQLIRVGVKNRGCSGLAYHLEYVEKPGTFDEAVEQDGVKVLIDSKALFSIIGSEMDYVEDKLSQRFVFKNPNIKEECGCGESFMV